jgi:hypothetical protein
MNFKNIIPVLPSQDVFRDIKWYEKHTGFKAFYTDKMYGCIKRGDYTIHLQWHADTEDDPLLGGSVLRLIVENIHPWIEEFVERKTINRNKPVMNTPWNTHEFGFFDLNKNGIFISQSLD